VSLAGAIIFRVPPKSQGRQEKREEKISYKALLNEVKGWQESL